MKQTIQPEKEILEAYDSFWVSNLSANMELFASYLVDDFSIFGSANGETFFTREDAVAFYTATADQLKDKAQLRNRSKTVQRLEENGAFVLELSDLYVLAGDEWIFYGHARITCILKKINGQWKALHQHASFPDYRTEDGEQLATEKIEQENLELREAVKRRTVELEAKNRELEIEAAVERVRAQSMAMQQTSDIAKVNEELFTQISRLNIDGFTGVAIYLVDEDEIVTVWDLSSPGSMGDLNSHAFKFDPQKTPTLSEFIPIWREGKEEYFIMDYPKERLLTAVVELEPFYPDMAASFRSAIASGALEHQWNATATIANGILSLDMMKPPTEEVKVITLKMAGAFSFAYQRFHDLRYAEKQTREAQIEIALERVRSRTMAMQHSNELADASFVLDSQVRALGIQTRGCAFNIYGENESTEWFSSEAGMLPPYKTPREDFFKRAYDAGQSGQPIYIEEFAGDDCKAHYEYLCTIPIMGDALRGMIEAGLSFPEKQVDHVTFFKYGYLLFITLEQVPDAYEIFIRFAKVFEQTYTRFLDLQKAEAQSVRAEQDLIEIKEARKRAEDTLVELQLTQKQLIQSEKMASLGELTAGIAHEIQNPLNFVNNFSDVSSELLDEMNIELVKGDMEEVKAIAADIKSNLEKINHHGKRADAIVKGMLQHSRKSEGQKEATDINALCDEYLRLSYHGLRTKDKNFNAVLKTDFDESAGKINIIPQDIGRVVMNLLTNAFYAVDERSKTEGDEYKPTVSMQTKKQLNYIELTVLDNGNGIPAEVKEKIYQPFFTTKPTGKGTGLGLSISYDIVKAHGGELKVESIEREFTRFVITLPV